MCCNISSYLFHMAFALLTFVQNYLRHISLIHYFIRHGSQVVVLQETHVFVRNSSDVYGSQILHSSTFVR